MTVPLHLLIDPPLDGPANMARDAALLDATGAGECPATLRCYRWSEPTVSLGYFQPYAEFELCSAVRQFPVVRRTTGGGAILHERELTYCLAVPSRHPLLSGGATNLYCSMHDAIIAVVRGLGGQAARRGSVRPDDAGGDEPFLCFERAHALDVVVGECKLAGSAQRRTPNAVLQHGSIVLDAIHPDSGVNPDGLARRIARQFADDNGLSLTPSVWQPSELDRANRHAVRYNSATWTRRR